MSMIRSRKILAHARGQDCTARFPGICKFASETTVFCHLNGAAFGKGIGIKAHDVLGFFGCASCHYYYDIGHGTHPELDNEMLIECVLNAVCETWVRLIADGIVIVPLDPERLSSERQVKPRKPVEKRKKIQSKTEWPEGRKLSSRNNLKRKKT